MIIADTSVWIDHFKVPSLQLTQLARQKWLLMHPYVIGELALGSLKNREQTLADLDVMRSAPVATTGEVLRLISDASLFSLGIGYVDVHLLASTLLLGDGRLLTRDRRLQAAAETLGVAA